jgi:hypothetical protein
MSNYTDMKEYKEFALNAPQGPNTAQLYAQAFLLPRKKPVLLTEKHQSESKYDMKKSLPYRESNLSPPATHCTN